MKKRTEDYFDAITNKKSLGGVDSDDVVEYMLEMEKRTEQKITKKELHGLLTKHGAQHLGAALKFTIFKSNRVKIRDWVGFLHFVTKKSIIEMLNMYKFEEARCA